MTCNQGLIYFQGRCISDCPSGTYYGDGSCLACSTRCLTCQGSAERCTSCLPSQYLYNRSCYTQCPVAIVNGICTDTCPGGSFLKGSSCVRCDASCQTCSGSATSCTSCANGYYSHLGNCIKDCPFDTLPRGSSCVACDSSCDGCSGSLLNCINCAAGFARLGSSCVQSCGNGFFIDASRNCRDCGLGCKTCTSATSCSSCFDPALSAVGGICQKSCPSGAIIDARGECACRFGFLGESGCVSTCLPGTYGSSSSRTCEPCSYPCATCTGSSTSCLTCATGFTYSSAQKACLAQSKC